MIPLKTLYPDLLLLGGQNPYKVLNTRLRTCFLFQVCIIQDGFVKACCIYTLHSLTTKWSWPNLVSLSMGFSCQVRWIWWRYDRHFSINSMPAGVSPLNDVCKICQVEARALLPTLTEIWTVSCTSKDHRCEIVCFSFDIYELSPCVFFSGTLLVSQVENALKYTTWMCQ